MLDNAETPVARICHARTAQPAPPVPLLLTGCGKDNNAGVFSSDPMLGCYATHARKPAEFRIEQQQGQYYVSFNRDEQWQRDATPLQESSRAEIAQFFRDDADQINKALVRAGGGFGIFKFNPGPRSRARPRTATTWRWS